MALSPNLERGIAAYKSKDYVAAERHLLAAMNEHPPAHPARRTVAIHLGMVHRRTVRYESAIEVLEQGLPYPGAFTELVSIYRFLAMVAMKEGNNREALEHYQKMFSLATIYATAMSFRLPISPVAVDWERGAGFIETVRASHGTLYPFKYQGRPVEGDTLLSKADWRALDSLSRT